MILGFIDTDCGHGGLLCGRNWKLNHSLKLSKKSKDINKNVAYCKLWPMHLYWERYLRGNRSKRDRKHRIDLT